MKALARTPYLLMLKDDSGEVNAIQLDVQLVDSDNALIVMDEINDTCWVWIGRNVSMPTRMHALRIARGLQKSGYKVGVTTIGLASARFVEMMEKDDTDPDVASAIAEFKSTIKGTWSFDDAVLAYKGEAKASTPIAGAPKKKLLPPEPEPEPEVATSLEPEPIAGAPETKPLTAAPELEPIAGAPKKKLPTPEPEPILVAETVVEPTPTPAVSASIAEKKMAYLMLSITRNSDLVYTERFEKGGKKGLKIESPGVMVIEAMYDGDFLKIRPMDFGGSETATKIKSEFEGLVKRL
ncbi:MAG: hypothetical protein E3J86_10815 [Candidatus Thorarchaeota archaeon]|nr:MAG: hypothetical protein E3J86_10815 [Candidatus Thorarchaeota archaeon]